MNEETRALEELMRDFKEHNTKYAKNYEDVCYSAIQSLQQQLKDKDEKINKIKTAMTWYYENSRLWDCEMTYLNGVHNGMYSTYEEIDEILKSNKED